jgi:hypothetical protein
MKKFLLLIIQLIAISYVYAQNSRLVISENFTDYPNGNLNTASSGLGSWRASFRNSSSDFVQIASSSPLLYPDYVSGSQYVNVIQKGDYQDGSWKSPDDPFTSFKDGMVTINAATTTFYVSFVVRVSSAGAVPLMGDARPAVALRTVNGSQFSNFYISSTDDGRGLKFGINKDASANGYFANATYSFNETYLIVIRYDVVNGEATSDYDDKMYLWVNPSLGSEPSVNTAQMVLDNFWDFNFDGGFNTPALSLQLFQEPESASASFDAFRVSYGQGFDAESATTAAAWNALNPAGIPLPFKFGSIKGYPKNKGVQINWDVLSETGVTAYEVERSGDGIHFSLAGKVSANGGEVESSYTWFDMAPSAGNNYYRVKNIFTTDAPLYSQVVRITLKNNEPLFSVYPNPAPGNHISFQITNLDTGDYKIELLNSMGQLVHSEALKHGGGTLVHAIESAGSKQAGVYVIQLTKRDFKLARQVLVR